MNSVDRLDEMKNVGGGKVDTLFSSARHNRSSLNWKPLAITSTIVFLILYEAALKCPSIVPSAE